MPKTVQPRCVCGSQEKVNRELRDTHGKWKRSARPGNGEQERITCFHCGACFIRTTEMQSMQSEQPDG